MGVDFATTEDAISATTRLITDTTINGKPRRIRVFVAETTNRGALRFHLGRTLGVVPRQLSPSGYFDMLRDDFDEGAPLHKLQSVASFLVYGEFGASKK